VSQPHTCHWQTQVLPWDGLDPASQDPSMAKPYRDGDIIPPGWRAMWLLVVTVQAYDPREANR
jgi:hypothetical protein